MHIETHKIGIDGGLQVSSEWALPERFDACPGLILAHGAGNDMHQPMLGLESATVGSCLSAHARNAKKAAKARWKKI